MARKPERLKLGRLGGQPVEIQCIPKGSHFTLYEGQVLGDVTKPVGQDWFILWIGNMGLRIDSETYDFLRTTYKERK